MSDYRAGTVATATVRGEPGVRVFRVATSEFDSDNWRSERIVQHNVIHEDGDVTDVRPLIVLDLDDWEHKIELLRQDGSLSLREVADQVEAQTKPPRIPEPGSWGVVEAGTQEDPSKRKLFVRYPDEGWCADAVSAYSWRNLVDPVLIRPGV